MYTEVKTSSGAKGRRIGIVVSQYHDKITTALRDAAIEKFIEAGGMEENLIVAPAPGAFELPAIAHALIQRGDLDAVVAIGCILTGETLHDRYIAQAVAEGLTAITARTGIPIAFGLLTCQTMAQAKARAGGEVGNKGTEAMAAAIETINTLQAIRKQEGKG
ncbi:MAG: 6,7-dimethyl-8-ribityllumazine synthase [Phycisphaerales bacterium]|nr:MAG: 6,7-dimethyl-8-ribityllumazine synthase [Phycisphaerales bacterium]